jgi:hypothetical protein
MPTPADLAKRIADETPFIELLQARGLEAIGLPSPVLVERQYGHVRLRRMVDFHLYRKCVSAREKAAVSAHNAHGFLATKVTAAVDNPCRDDPRHTYFKTIAELANGGVDACDRLS